MSGFISLVKSHMEGIIVDVSCVDLIDHLNNYQYDDNRKPIHDDNSHYASAFGYMVMALYYELNWSPVNSQVIQYGA